MCFAERKRRIARTEAPSLEQWLESLEMKVVAEPLSQANLDRAAQLFNKTNQMNLSTRRLTKDELWSWSRLSTTQFLTFKVSDRFGDYGLVGLCSFSRQSRAKAAARIVDFLLSCRVMGRRIEEVMFHVLTEYAKGFGCQTLSATYIATDRNAPCLKFLTMSGLARKGDTFHWDLEHAYPPPCGIEVIIPLRKSAFTSDQSDLVGESIVFV